ncbi:hypothetical protein L6452_39748 [Arctium lappa]|uniref:Uncharacterized protein n=1 Tax=Arctium lappa TaxID=4217 RepID=A0ACB8XUA9_ARCLA|nr:hypothetical protein L6452_39748 [Arctium lappa]
MSLLVLFKYNLPFQSLRLLLYSFAKKELSLRLRIALVTTTCSVVLMVVAFVTGTLQYGRILVEPKSPLDVARSTAYNNTINSVPHRKLLQNQAREVEPNRIWGDKCSKADIVINQGPTDPLPSGIPTYTVEIMNVCTTGCDISGIHLTCGWFSSARLINPHLFKRLRYNDCLVNDGNTLVNGHTISFQYANTFPYPLSVSSVIC